MVPFITRVRVCVIASTIALLAAPLAGHAQARHAAPPTVTQVRLTPSTAEAGVPVSARLTVRSTACIKTAVIAVGVRDAAGRNLDFPGGLSNQSICPQDLTVTTVARSFPAGKYRIFGYYRDPAGSWHNLPEQTLTVAAAPPPKPIPTPTPTPTPTPPPGPGPSPEVTQVRLLPSAAGAGVPVVAQLTVRSTACFTAAVVGVGVRDAAGNNLDFPGGLWNQQICPQDLTVTTDARSFPAGSYRIFGMYQDLAGGWHSLSEQTLTVAAALPPSPIPGAKLIWSDEFDGPLSADRWNRSKSSSFRYGTYNPDDDKLDKLDPTKVTVADGVATFTATPSAFKLSGNRQAWDTGMLTTEDSPEHFMVKTGDYAETRVRMPAEMGAWPALWTWRDGGNEVDSFEYHPDNPNLLELTNHVKPAQSYWDSKGAVKPGDWVVIGTHYGADSVGWYINGVDVFEDHVGVGPNWSAYLILNLSICSGTYHPDPGTAKSVSFAADYLRVYR